MGFQRIVVQGVWDLVGRSKCTVVLVEEGTATTVVLVEFKVVCLPTVAQPHNTQNHRRLRKGRSPGVR